MGYKFCEGKTISGREGLDSEISHQYNVCSDMRGCSRRFGEGDFDYCFFNCLQRLEEYSADEQETEGVQHGTEHREELVQPANHIHHELRC